MSVEKRRSDRDVGDPFVEKDRSLLPQKGLGDYARSFSPGGTRLWCRETPRVSRKYEGPVAH